MANGDGRDAIEYECIMHVWGNKQAVDRHCGARKCRKWRCVC